MAIKYAFLSAVLLAAASGPPAQQPPIARTTTTGVVVDVHVIDRDGKPVLDLRPEEFELSEDGKRQRIAWASLVHAGAVRPLDAPSGAASDAAQPQPPSSTAGTLAAQPSRPHKTPSITAILFDRLSPEMRPLAHRAAVTYLSTLSPPYDYAGVLPTSN